MTTSALAIRMMLTTSRMTVKFSLAKMAKEQGKGGTQRLRPIEERAGTIVRHRRVLTALLRRLAAVTRETVLPRIAAEPKITQDAAAESWFDDLRRERARLEREAEERVRDIHRDEAERHTRTFAEAARAALGVDIRALVRNEDLDDYLRTQAARNAALIRSLSEDAVSRVEQLTYAAVTNGTSQKEVRRQMARLFRVTKSRADLIASDQVAKLNSDLSEIRQTQAGVAKYVWRTSQDERVRPRHRRLDGKEYRWGERTDAEEGLSPGKPIRCRCVAIPVVEI